MRTATLVRAGLAHFWRTNLGLALGALVTATTLVGALVVGDSVRHSLARRAEARVGRVQHALDGGDRFFREALGELGEACAPAIRLDGVVSTARGDRRVPGVQLLGVDERFFALAPTAAGGNDRPAPEARAAFLSEALARRLGVEAEDSLLLRVEAPSALPRDMALAPAETAIALRLRVAGVLAPEAFGDFDLLASSRAPLNLFVNLAWLQQELDLAGRANLLLARGDGPRLADELRARWDLADAELGVIDLPDGGRELRTPRVFFDGPVVERLRASPVPLLGVFTYFVNGLEHGERSTPYSMVSGLGPLGPPAEEPAPPWRALVPTDAEEGIVLQRWTADDLAAEVGARLTLRYFLVDPRRRLVEAERAFTVSGIVELEGAAADPTLMPDFPGLADAENCRDWEPGTPVDLERIRDEDEAWWDEHRGTPKAFVSLAAAESMWTNRYGALTAVRFARSDEAALVAALRDGLDPAELGLWFRDLGAEARAASESPTDFGGLFVGLSLFLIVAAVVLSVQLFQLGVQQRSREIGLLLALGLGRGTVVRVLLSEAAVLAAVGVVLGAALGLGYTRGILALLDGLWRDAVSGTVLAFHARPTTVAVGALSALAVVLATVGLSLRARLRHSARALIATHPGDESLAETGQRTTRRRVQAGALALAWALALGLVFAVDPSAGPAAAGAYFGAGALALSGGLLAVRLGLHGRAAGERGPVESIRALGVSGTRRRPGRSLATVATMAIGTFLVLAIGSQRQGPTPAGGARDSGTGGFALFGRTSLPVVRDLNDARGRELFGLEAEELEGVRFVPLRVRAGDDASCLNLSRAARPRLVGVDPQELAARGAFRFTESTEELDASPWTLLDRELPSGAVPAVVDATSLAWQLHLGLGDRIEYLDERGEPFEVQIVGAIADSILQGDVIVAEERFRARFPLEGGHRAFLVDAPRERVEAVSARLTRALEDVGLALEETHHRLDGFHAVQNGYLAIFQVLGALGLLLGSVGLGTTLLRNTHERRRELAVVGALGYAARDLRRWILAEYGTLLVLGLLLGGAAALVVVLPARGGPASDLSLGQVLALFAVVLGNGLLWIAVATHVAVRRVPRASLCEE